MKLLPAATIASAALLALPAWAAPAKPGEEKVSQLIVYGDDVCPKSTDEEIVVCARKPERERYRIPERLRGDPNDPTNQAWANKAERLEYVGRGGIGSCSPTGPGGMVGCFNQIVREARADRATREDVNWNALIEQARQERLSKIDTAAKAEEEANKPQ